MTKEDKRIILGLAMVTGAVIVSAIDYARVKRETARLNAEIDATTVSEIRRIRRAGEIVGKRIDAGVYDHQLSLNRIVNDLQFYRIVGQE